MRTYNSKLAFKKLITSAIYVLGKTAKLIALQNIKVKHSPCYNSQKYEHFFYNDAPKCSIVTYKRMQDSDISYG